MRFGEKVRDLRKKHSLTQDELAKCLGVSKRTVIGFFLQFVSTKVTLILLIMFVAFLYLLNNSSTIDSKPSLNFALLLLIP